jgi:biopolymer transport protein ExbB
MSQEIFSGHTIWGIVTSGGFTMYPLVVCSLVAWGVIFERLWSYRRLGDQLQSFHLEAMNCVLRKDLDALRTLCHKHQSLPTARLILVALDRIASRDSRLRSKWQEALERKRQVLNQELRRNLWILGTIGSASPFIGLFGTVVGILQSFQHMAQTGSGGFAVVAAGISEALVATAAGIVVAVISVMFFNAFQTRWNGLILTIRVQAEELSEVLSTVVSETPPSSQKDLGHGL